MYISGRLLDPNDRKIIHSRDLKFNENAFEGERSNPIKIFVDPVDNSSSFIEDNVYDDVHNVEDNVHDMEHHTKMTH